MENVEKVALIGPQCFIDGAPPVPEWGARLGVRVLRSWPLRALANRIAYFDKSLGTEDAIRVVPTPGFVLKTTAVAEAPAKKADARATSASPLALLRLRGVPSVCVAYFVVKMVRYCLMFWLPYFLKVERGLSASAAA